MKGGEENMGYRRKLKVGLIKRRENKVKEVLEMILDEKGKLTPQHVVDEARNPDSPLHSRFEWNNEKGGEKYRLMQARLLITQVKVGIIPGEKQKAFYNVKVELGEREYIPRTTVLSDAAMQKQVLIYAAKQLKHWTDEYREISQFDGVVNEPKLQAILDSENEPTE